MLKQEKIMGIRIDDDLKAKFKEICDKEYQTISARIKYLMKKDIDGKLEIK